MISFNRNHGPNGQINSPNANFSWRWNLSDDTVWFSPEASIVLGKDCRSIRDYFGCVHASDRARVIDLIRQARISRKLNGNRSLRITHRVLVDDRVRWIELNTQDGSGIADAIIGTITDITNQTRRSCEDKTDSQTPNGERNEKSDSKLRGILRTLGALADAADEADVSTNAMLEMLRSSGRDLASEEREVLGLLEKLRVDMNRLQKLISDREHVKYGADFNQSEFFCIRNLMQETLLMFEDQIQDDQIDVQLRMANELPRFSGNPVQVRQVLINLVKHAIHDCRERTFPQIVVTISTDDKNLNVTIENNGNLASSIEQCDNSTSFPPSGLLEAFELAPVDASNIRVSISKRIVKLHGGELQTTAAPHRNVHHFNLPITADKR